MSELLGKRIGHFRVTDVLGKGGMGDIYLGFDETLERKVALKSIRAEFKLNDEAKARFLREARVLSQLAHPNICQIYDYIDGADADLLVLELIRGRTLSTAIKEGLDYGQKLKVARQVAQVLVAAHERNIVHRDLKPDNVMLTEKGDVKVLDFGLSRSVVENTMALERDPEQPTIRLTPETQRHADFDTNKVEPPRKASDNFTVHGAIMGTPGYMSPEQAAGEQATPASDMYSFGLMLQQLFTGKRPFEAGLSGPEMVQRAYAAVSLPVEGVEPDLAVLINRLKSKAPDLRPSAVDALDQLQWIADRPHRRRKRALIASAIVALTVFGIVMTLQTIRATRAERAAEREAQVSKNVTTFMVDLFDVSNPFEKKSGETVTAREILDKGAEKIEEELKGEPDVQARMMATIGTVYRKLGLFDQARPQLDRARAVIEKSHKADDPEVADILYARASLHSDQGEYAEAEPLFKRSLAIREKVSGPTDPNVADVLNNMGALYARQGKFEQAQPLLERSLAIREKAFGSDAPIVADGLNNLALVHSIQGRGKEAEAMYKRSLAIREKAFGADHPRVADSLNNLAVDYFENGRFAEAEPLAERALAIFEKTLGPEHPHVAHSLNNLAEIRHLQGDYAGADPLYERSLAIYEKVSGPAHPDVAYELTYLGKLRVDQKRLVEAGPLLKRALSIYDRAVGLNHPDAAHTLFNLAALEASRDNRAGALEYLKRSFPAGAGTTWAESMENEPAFASLRENPEFQRIVAEARKAGG